jgi:hypothetical protein
MGFDTGGAIDEAQQLAVADMTCFIAGFNDR